jgi:alkylhydroperoxidase family enzyme
MPRIEPLTEPYEPEIEQALRKWMPPGVGYEPLALFRVLHKHADLVSPQSGLTEAQIESTWHGGPDDPVWTDRHRALLRAADELNDTTTLADAVWDELRAYYDDEQLIEFMVLTGWYRIIANVANTTRLAPESWAIPRKPLPR